MEIIKIIIGAAVAVGLIAAFIHLIWDTDFTENLCKKLLTLMLVVVIGFYGTGFIFLIIMRIF